MGIFVHGKMTDVWRRQPETCCRYSRGEDELGVETTFKCRQVGCSLHGSRQSFYVYTVIFKFYNLITRIASEPSQAGTPIAVSG